MLEESEVIQATGFYGGSTTRDNFDIELKMKFNEGEVLNAIKFIAGIGTNIKLIAKVDGENVKLGTWGVYKLSIDKNLMATVIFKTAKEHAFLENLSKLLVEETEITVKAKIIEGV